MSTATRTKLRRLPKRGISEREAIRAILDEAIVCHLGLIDDAGFPVVVPTLHVRVGTQRVLGSCSEICLTATLLDGLVLARSAFHHSANYRSVMLFGRAEQLEDPEEKSKVLEAFIEKLVPGRWPEIRHPTRSELKGTSVLRIPLEEVSAKVRSGPPLDDEPDYELPVWAGVIDLHLQASTPEPDGRLLEGVEVPGYVRDLVTENQ
jgi:uncharacterized protein